MKTLQVLNNNNKLYSETASDVFYPKQKGDFSMHLVFNGTENYQLNGRSINVHPGNFLVLNEGTEYARKIDSLEPVRTFSLFFSSAYLQDFHNNYTSKDEVLLDNPFETKNNFPPRFMETLYPFAGDLKFNMMHLKEHFDQKLDNDMLMNEYMHHALLLYYGIYNREIVSKSNNLSFLNKQTKVEILRRLTIAKDYILSNFEQPLTLEDISKQACLSVNHFLRTFKQAFDCSPHQFLMKVRLMHARILLKDTSYPVNEIVSMVGFECTSSFIRLFKNSFKLTPGGYRSLQKQVIHN